MVPACSIYSACHGAPLGVMNLILYSFQKVVALYYLSVWLENLVLMAAWVMRTHRR
jgi:uncharacterized membrane protein